MASIKMYVSVTDGRHDIVGDHFVGKVEGSTRKQMFVNAIRTFQNLRTSEKIKTQIRQRTFPTFSKWEFLLTNAKSPVHNVYGTTVYWVRKKDNDWEILELNKDWKPSDGLRKTIYFPIYRIPNAKVKHPMAEDFMVKLRGE